MGINISQPDSDSLPDCDISLSHSDISQPHLVTMSTFNCLFMVATARVETDGWTVIALSLLTAI